MNKSEKIELLRDAIKSYPDFPKAGIIFRDIFGVFHNLAALRAMKDLIVEHILFLEIDLVVGLESRGFLLGPIVSMELGKPFLPVRKKGKLPGKVLQQSYVLEYGEATLEIQTEYVNEGARVLIVDDLLATGGSMGAAIKLLNMLGAKVVECLAVIELTGLKGRDKLDVPVHSIIQYD